MRRLIQNYFRNGATLEEKSFKDSKKKKKKIT